MAKITLDTRKVNSLVSSAFKTTMQEFNKALDRSIRDPLYSWPRETRRSRGRTVGSPRNIIDTRKLFSSKTVNRASQVWLWSWTVPYALIVHEGTTLRSGTELPARRWTLEAQKLYPLEKNYAENLRKIL